MFGINEYYDDLLLEAKSPEEIKAALKYKFVEGQGVPQEVLDAIFDADPTKKKSYTGWLLALWGKERDAIVEAIKDGTLKRMFEYFQSRANTGLNLTSMKSLAEAMEMLPYVDPILTKEGNGGPEDDYDIMFQSDEWVVAVPHTYEADRKLGRGMRWCTAGAFGDNDSWWRRYSPAGPLWVNFDKRKSEIGRTDGKEYPYKRYQFLFEWENWRGECKDLNDDDVLIKPNDVDMPEDVIEFYGEQNEKYKTMIEEGRDSEASIEERWEEYNDARWEHSHCVLSYRENYLTLMPKEAQEPDMNFGTCDYYLYDEEQDTSDPILYTSFSPDDYLIKSYRDYPIVILKDWRGRAVVATCDASGSRWRRYEFNTYENIEFYGDNDNVVYFVSNDEFYLYDSDGCLSKVELPYYEEDISNIFFNNMDSYEIEGFESCYWIEIVDKKGFHSLYYIDVDHDDTIRIVKRDIPVNGEEYVLEFENGVAYVQGKFSRHYLTDDEDEEREQSFNLEAELSTEGYFIVDLGNNSLGQAMFNIYNNNEKKMLLEKPFNNYDKIRDNSEDYRLGYYDGDNRYVNIFNASHMRIITPSCEHITKFFHTYVCENPIGKEPGTYFLLETEEGAKRTGLKCRKVIKHLYNYMFLVRLHDENYLNVLNVGTGKVTLPQGVTNWGELSNYGTNPDRPYLLILMENENIVKLINIETNKIITSGLASKHPQIILDNGDDFAVIFKYEDGKYNVLYNEKIVLPQNVELFSCIDTEKYNRNKIFSFRNNGLYYFLNLNTLEIMPPRGIDTALVCLSRLDRNGYYVFIATNDNFSFLYNPLENSVVKVENDNPEYMQKANAIINSQAVQVAENFRKIYKKIIDIDRSL